MKGAFWHFLSRGQETMRDALHPPISPCKNITIISIIATLYSVGGKLKQLQLVLNLINYTTNFCLPMQDLTRFAIQAKGSDGKWTRKSLAYRESNNVHLRVTRPHEICVNLVFKHIHAASSYTICRQFVPFIYCTS